MQYLFRGTRFGMNYSPTCSTCVEYKAAEFNKTWLHQKTRIAKELYWEGKVTVAHIYCDIVLPKHNISTFPLEYNSYAMRLAMNSSFTHKFRFFFYSCAYCTQLNALISQPHSNISSHIYSSTLRTISPGDWHALLLPRFVRIWENSSYISCIVLPPTPSPPSLNCCPGYVVCCGMWFLLRLARSGLAHVDCLWL